MATPGVENLHGTHGDVTPLTARATEEDGGIDDAGHALEPQVSPTGMRVVLCCEEHHGRVAHHTRLHGAVTPRRYMMKTTQRNREARCNREPRRLVRAAVVGALVTLFLIATVAQAVAQEPPAGGLVPSAANFGWTQGQFSVSGDGAAQYRLPLWVPRAAERRRQSWRCHTTAAAAMGRWGWAGPWAACRRSPGVRVPTRRTGSAKPGTSTAPRRCAWMAPVCCRKTWSICRCVQTPPDLVVVPPEAATRPTVTCARVCYGSHWSDQALAGRQCTRRVWV